MPRRRAPRYRASHRAMRGHITDEEIEALAQYYANMPH
jgi:cytochrome c553